MFITLVVPVLNYCEEAIFFKLVLDIIIQPSSITFEIHFMMYRFKLCDLSINTRITKVKLNFLAKKLKYKVQGKVKKEPELLLIYFVKNTLV